MNQDHCKSPVISPSDYTPSPSPRPRYLPHPNSSPHIDTGGITGRDLIIQQKKILPGLKKWENIYLRM